MKYIPYENISQRGTKDIEDAEIFVAFRKDKSWSFGMRVRGMFTFTSFRKENASMDEVQKAKRQIMFCKKYGWSYLGRKVMNPDSFEMEWEFMCMYCHTTTFDTTSPCACRNTKIEDMFQKTSKGGIILPY